MSEATATRHVIKNIFIYVYIFISHFFTLILTVKEGWALRQDHQGGPLGGRGMRPSVPMMLSAFQARCLGALHEAWSLKWGGGGRPHSPA